MSISVADQCLQQWIDGINNPQWGRDQWQIFTPTSEPAVNYAKYQFSVVN
jgi:aldose 1-epimerase